MALTALASCAEKEPFSTASDGDYPRIIDPVFPDWTDGAKPVVSNIGRDTDFSMTLTVTPADYCTVRWYLDGEIVGEGKEIELGLMAGTYDFKVEVSGPTKSVSNGSLSRERQQSCTETILKKFPAS